MRTRKSCKGSSSSARGFTLIEVLVVVAIIALLIGILLPSLANARFESRVVVCQSNLHQLGLGITSYANSFGKIPFGPAVQAMPPFLEANDGTLSTNQIWTGPQHVGNETSPRPQPMSLGLLLPRASMWPAMMYCPGDDSNDPVEELEKVRSKSDSAAYSSYLYRQLQETNGRGKLEDLGKNGDGRRVAALALDMNAELTLVPGGLRTNHKARRVNILYLDASARSFHNFEQEFSLRDQDLADLAARRAEILRQADLNY